MKNKYNYFYERFINESRIKAIDDINIQSKFWTYFFSIALFSIVSVTFPTFVGFNFDNIFAICIFCFDVIMYFLLTYFSIKFIILDNKYKIFKKKTYAIGFCLGFFLLSIIFTTIACFTTEFVSNADNSFNININPAFYLFIFIPLFFGYLIFCYYAFMKCFGKYTKSSTHIKNDTN